MSRNYIYHREETNKLHDAFHRWMNHLALEYYESPELALSDAVEFVQEWGQNWIEDAHDYLRGEDKG